jgi:hypothetical protein
MANKAAVVTGQALAAMRPETRARPIGQLSNLAAGSEKR